MIVNLQQVISATSRLCVSLALAVGSGAQCAADLAAQKLNIVTILIDDMGYVNQGAAVASSYEFDMAQDEELALSANREIPVRFLEIHELKSIWEAK